jgi:ubiquinol-cytochrome c reductase iron-sulfur subunit
MRTFGRWILALIAVVLGFARERRRRRARGRIVPEGEQDRRAENVVIVLLLVAILAAAAFIGIYATGGTIHGPLPNKTQLLGGAMALALGCIAAALMIIGKRLVVTEEIEEEYPPDENPEDSQAVTQIVEESGSRFRRKRLLIALGGMTATALGLAAVTPAVSFGPVFTEDRFNATPWRRGRRLVDENGHPYQASDIRSKTFYTAFPEGANPSDLGSAIIVVRLDPSTLNLPSDRPADRWAPQGIVAYSKICTHAGCAISLYRKPTFPPVEPKPALVCPCHYSTFDPSDGGTVEFGPAGRDLPQLPLMIDFRGGLRANGNFSGPIGPSWWGVRLYKPTST